ncbi:MAG TPA: hypothetical protein VM364_02325 [Vicinamibacterales bacterium]|nr:hypothetical protein [Vicinamibacterales bacterium]
MSNQMRRGTSFDRAIDAALRDMVEVDPRPGLGRRVLRRMDRRRTPVPRAAWLRAAIAGGAALALLTVALLTFRSAGVQPVDPPQVVTQPPAAPAIPHAEPRAADTRPVVAAPPGRRQPAPEAIFGERRDRVSAATVSAREPVAAGDEQAMPLGGFSTGGRPPETAIAPLAVPPEILIRPIELAPIPSTAPRGGSR